MKSRQREQENASHLGGIATKEGVTLCGSGGKLFQNDRQKGS